MEIIDLSPYRIFKGLQDLSQCLVLGCCILVGRIDSKHVRIIRHLDLSLGGGGVDTQNSIVIGHIEERTG